jgi:hypothetical protein
MGFEIQEIELGFANFIIHDIFPMVKVKTGGLYPGK